MTLTLIKGWKMLFDGQEEDEEDEDDKQWQEESKVNIHGISFMMIILE